jgi:large subunit ribosomal protein L9|tara:strand:+ start:464 stop:919 length:456 start_codon:yes stop_codon:yes gene_type:complete
MQVILLENVMKLGKIGDLVEVKNGYGRNFLLKTGKALRADKENIALVNKKKNELNKKNEESKKEFKETATIINNKTLTFSKEAKDNGDLFGSIKPKEISSAFLSELKVEINPSQIDLKKEIDKIGSYKVDINLYSEVSASITVIVKKIESN